MFTFYWLYERQGVTHVALKINNDVIHISDVESLKQALTSVKCLVTYGNFKELALFLSEGKSSYLQQYLHIDLSQELGNKTIEEIGYFNQLDMRAKTIEEFCEKRIEICEFVFEKREAYIENKLEIIKDFKLKPSSISKTRANLAAEVLGAVKQPNRATVLMYQLDPRIPLGELPSNLVKFYQRITDTYKATLDDKLKNEKLKMTLCNLTHTFGVGGVHAAKEKYKGEGIFLHIDVKSFFTSIMINNDFVSAGIKKKEVLKQLHDKKNIEGNEAYKTLINAVVGQ